MNQPSEFVDTYRYPGTRPFKDTEHDRRLFFGREREAEIVFQTILRDNLTILSGQSGLGKTSLLHASIFPRLRNQRFVVLTVRLSSDLTTPMIKETIDSSRKSILMGFL
jgi:MoxR-like ATPase